MDKHIDSRFERLEKALTGLIDSVNKYHPSTNQAKELETADIELTKGLEQVQIHQNNYLRIQELRKSSNALDTQIRDTLSSLASTRKDIVSTPTTTFPQGPNYPFTYQELLNYARLISKTTLPSASALKAGLGAAPTPETHTPLPESTQQTGGLTPSAAATPSNPQSPAVANGVLSSQQQTTQQTAASSNTQLNPQVSEWLNPLSNQPFIPYPLEGAIRSGNLAAIQSLSSRGIDPKGYDPAEEEARKQREAEERREREERERIEVQEREQRQREERERLRQEAIKQREKDQEAWRKGSFGAEGGPAKAPEKKQFQFSSLDDLDDDDDDDD